MFKWSYYDDFTKRRGMTVAMAPMHHVFILSAVILFDFMTNNITELMSRDEGAVSRNTKCRNLEQVEKKKVRATRRLG